MNKKIKVNILKNSTTPLLYLCFMFLLTNCASKKITDISYIKDSVALVENLPKLNVFKTRKSTNNPVVIFIHGGYWTEGKKGIYGF